MPFDKPTRNALARMVGAARERLKADLTAQLQTDFRLQPDGTALPLDGLTDDQRAAAADLRALLDHYAASIPGPEKSRRALAFDRLVREIGFTVLNRLAALRLCEERELVLECVRQGMASEGFQLFDRLTGGALGPRYDTYRAFLENLFDELALDLGVLFDRRTPLSHVFPSERALEDVLKLLNDPALTHLWKEDETIGWIYQYYNDEAERKQMRDESQAPRNSRELAVRNQFFTPRYVVEFLTDNTLGRLWYEMRGGDTKLIEECRFLVRRPEEKSAAVGIPQRVKKDPREIKMLDPAGGSGHFGLYCFDLFEIIYAEAYDDADLGPALQAEYPDRAAFLCDVPRLILAHNIHVIDIDPRAVQIAALALWLRAQRSFQRLGLKPSERPQIRKVNVVCAEPMPGDSELLNDFAAALRPAVLGDLVRVIFDKMQLAGEAGSLLKIEEEIQAAIAEAKRQWLNRDQAEQLSLFASERRPARAEQAPLFDLTGITDEQFWDEAEARVLEALQGYAELASNGATARRRLFADDAAHGFAFIDLCRKRYEVVLMNPPFGDSSIVSRKFIHENFEDTKRDVGFSFVERWRKKSALLGNIVSRTCWFLSSFENWRRKLLQESQVVAAADLGFGVLDQAMVETVAFVTQEVFTDTQRNTSTVIRLVDTAEKGIALQRACNTKVDYGFSSDMMLFLDLPGCVFSYWAPRSNLDLFHKFPNLHPKYAQVSWGLFSADDERFLRLWWEAPPEMIGKIWYSYAKGGDYAEYYSPLDLVIQWSGDGKEISENRDQEGKSRSRIPNSEWYFRPGLTYSSVTIKGFAVRTLPAECIFSIKGPSIVSSENKITWALLGYLNTSVARRLMLYQTPSRSWDVPLVRRLPIPVSALEELARISFDRHEVYRKLYPDGETSRQFLPTLLNLNIDLRHALQEANNQSEHHRESWYDLGNQIERKVLDSFDLTMQNQKPYLEIPTPAAIDNAEDDIIQKNFLLINDLISILWGYIFGRWDIRIALDPTHATKLQDPFDPLPVCPPGMLVGPDGLPATPERIVSNEWLRARPNAITLPPEGAVHQPTIPDHQYPLRLAWDGILVDDPGVEGEGEHPDDIVRRGREALAVLWGDRTEAIETEACELLGVPDLRDYFRKPSAFFADHLKCYSKSRRQAPIYWPLSTASGSYTVWLYYHRLTQDTLYTVVNQYVTPKIEAVQKRVDQLDEKRRSAEGKGRSTAAQLEELKAFLRELTDFRAELLRVAALPYKPDLNDGVILNAAPLHKLFRLSKWAKDCKAAWDKLAAGEYDWAHIAYTLWPERVKKVCETDRSIAIAHGLEGLYKGEVKVKKGKGKGRKRNAEETAEAGEIELLK